VQANGSEVKAGVSPKIAREPSVKASVGGYGKSRERNKKNCQSTIAQKVLLSGVGIHSGRPVSIAILPAPTNTGFIFSREGAGEIQAIEKNVVLSDYGVTLGRKGRPLFTSVSTILSALSGLQIDNAIIQLDGAEVPAFDGSASIIVDALRDAGIVTSAEPRKYIKLLKPIRMAMGESYGELLPNDEAVFEATTRFDHPLLGLQSVRIVLNPNSYRKEIAPARSFGFMKDVAMLWSREMALGASFDNTVVFTEERVLNPDGLRFPDECTRYKILGAIGDFALAGAQIWGCYKSHMGSHKLNHAIISRLLADETAFVRVSAPNV
jgi:UDP-3-O-[3-hydroxymyristoyl] N-acetylglucosamine deacetylase